MRKLALSTITLLAFAPATPIVGKLATKQEAIWEIAMALVGKKMCNFEVSPMAEKGIEFYAKTTHVSLDEDLPEIMRMGMLFLGQVEEDPTKAEKACPLIRTRIEQFEDLGRAACRYDHSC